MLALLGSRSLNYAYYLTRIPIFAVQIIKAGRDTLSNISCVRCLSILKSLSGSSGINNSLKVADHLLLFILAMVKEKVGGQLLVLVAREIRLDGQVALEAKATQPLYGVTFCLGDSDRGGTWRHLTHFALWTALRK